MAGRPPSGFRLGTGAGGRAPLGTGVYTIFFFF